MIRSGTTKTEQEAARAARAAFGFPDRGKDVVGVWQVGVAASDFIGRFVHADGDAVGRAEPIGCEMAVIANPGPGRLILRYDFGPGGVIYAKLYPDDLAPADPARDVAEFLHALRWEAFKVGYDFGRADAACRAFLEAYVPRVPEAAPAIAACWSACTLVTLLRYAKRTHTPEAERQRQMDFLLGEMRRIGEYEL